MPEQANPTVDSGRRTSFRAAHGTCGFRMMPSDALADAPSDALLTMAGAEAATLHYTWRHPQDGPQSGVVLVGGTDPETGRVEGALHDTWHQQPGLMPLDGTREGSTVRLRGSYLQEWGWEVDVSSTEDELTMTMRNVVPQSAVGQMPPDAPPMTAGPYDVMVARWRWDAGTGGST